MMTEVEVYLVDPRTLCTTQHSAHDYLEIIEVNTLYIIDNELDNELHVVTNTTAPWP